MDEQEYIKTRLENQIEWYDKKSQHSKYWFKSLRLIEIIFAALIPFWAGVGVKLPCYQVIIAGLGVAIAVSASIGAVNKYQENWIEYRTTTETLKHEKYLFQTKCKPYDGDNSYHRLVQRVESLISKENSQWSRYSKNDVQLP